MVNSYETVTGNMVYTMQQVTPAEAAKRYRQGEFLKRNHHHLISPWMYTPQQIEARNKALMLMNFDLAPRLKPLGDGEIVIDEMKP